MIATSSQSPSAERRKSSSSAESLFGGVGTGSGKTNTLAHRVAHLIVHGADPRWILLMTFSRRAASEMAKRVERIARKVLGADAGIMTDALSWAGTFHGIGARLLREYADQIGLNPAFIIHDREDSADLMNLVRHEGGLSKTESRFLAWVGKHCADRNSRSVSGNGAWWASGARSDGQQAIQKGSQW
jgi:UvrD/REP helicase N-terminal domain